MIAAHLKECEEGNYFVMSKLFKNKRVILFFLLLNILFYQSNAFSAENPPQEASYAAGQNAISTHFNSFLPLTHLTHFTGNFDTINTYITQRQPTILGFLQTDYAYYVSSATRLGNGEIIRRAYLGIVGDVTPDWGYIFVVDFANNEVDIRDAYLKYFGFNPVFIRVGNIKEPMGLEHLEEPTDLTFLERALPINAFILDRRIGVDFNTFGDIGNAAHYTGNVGVFGVEVGHVVVHQADESSSIVGRTTIALGPSANEFVHFGVSGAIRKPDSNKQVNYNSQPESDVTNVTLVNTGVINNVSYIYLYGLEAAVEYRQLSLQSEYLVANLHRFGHKHKNNNNLRFKGGYIYGSWVLTGESRGYLNQKGTFASIAPCHRFGAWEVALRFSTVNLDSDPIIGGKENNYTFGLNWYPNKYVRFMGNVIKVVADQAGVHNVPNIYTIRAQISFG
jgi:phosphate-selective porin OprO and OprP